MIEHEGLAAGSKLPSERKLATQLGVSRHSLREAVRKLELMGVVRVRQGAGTFVERRPPKFRLEESLAALTLSGEITARDFLEVRHCVEIYAVGLAALRADIDAILVLEKYLRLMRNSLEKMDIQEMIDADLDFHMAIVVATDNPLLVQVFQSLNEMLDRAQHVLEPNEALLWQVIKDHGEILSAIRGKDVSRAQFVLERHLVDTEIHFVGAAMGRGLIGEPKS